MKKSAKKIMGLILALVMVISVITVADMPAKATEPPEFSMYATSLVNYEGGTLSGKKIMVDDDYALFYSIDGGEQQLKFSSEVVDFTYEILRVINVSISENVIYLELGRFYQVTVVNGTTQYETYAYGDTVKITADPITDDQSKIFDKWASEDGVTFADATSSTTTFTMPAKAVTVTGSTKDKKKYTVKYNANGGTGSLADTENVYLGDIFGLPSKTVFTAPEGKEFSYWTVSGVDGLFEAGSTVKIVENLAQNGIITVTANWKKKENADDDDDVDDDNNDDVDDGNKDDDKNDDDDNPTGGKTVYNIVKGAGAEYTKGSNEGLEFIFKGDAEEDKAYENCKGYDIDLNDIPEGMGSLTKGSAVINIKPEYLDTLPTGEHMLNVYFTDGDTVHVTFNVKDAEKAAEKTDKKDETPKSDTAKKTGDSTNAALILSIMLLTSVGAAYVIGKRKKMNEE